MIHDIKTFNAQCDKCGKWFGTIPYPSHRSLVVALLAMDWEVDDDYEYIHCDACKTPQQDTRSNPIKADWKAGDSKPLRGGFAEEP